MFSNLIPEPIDELLLPLEPESDDDSYPLLFLLNEDLDCWGAAAVHGEGRGR
jgi:hypothetical protein